LGGLLSKIADTIEDLKDELVSDYYYNELKGAPGVVSVMWSETSKKLCVLVEPEHAGEIKEFLEPDFIREMRNHFIFMCREF